MGRLTLISLLAGLNFYLAGSQEKSDFASVDRLTYELYLNASWRELIRAGEEALSMDIDYFYLRMRLGIAAYELEDYSKAVRHFRKAVEFNSSDDTAMEYLYFAFLFYGRPAEAREVARGFSQSLKRKISDMPAKRLRSISLNITGSMIGNPDIIDGYSIDIDPGLSGYQSVTRNFQFFGGEFEHNVSDRTFLKHAIGYYSKSYMLYLREDDAADIDNNARYGQFQYYLSGRIFLGNGTYLTPSVHYVNARIADETIVVQRGRASYTVQQYYYRHDFATNLSLEKFAGKVKPAISAGYSSINEQQQLQGSFTFSWFPTGNLNLYSVSDIVVYSGLSPDRNSIRTVFSQEAGFRVFPGLWLEVRGSFGEVENYAGYRASIIYNDTGTIREQYGISLIAPFFSRGLQLSMHYSYTLQESQFMPADPAAVIPLNLISINYHKITGGIKWMF